jgi:uracil-DNA glycosylase family 4
MPSSFQLSCVPCPYHPQNGHSQPSAREQVVPLSVETNSSEYLLVFQAPGIDEWDEGKPLCSNNRKSAAARVHAALGRVGKSRSHVSIANATQCYPGRGNTGRDKAPSEAARTQCLHWLDQDLRAHSNARIVVFGAIAKKSVLELGYKADDPRFVFLRHPSGGLRNTDLDGALM